MIKIAEALVKFVADISGVKAGAKDAELTVDNAAKKIGASLGSVAKWVFPAGIGVAILAAGKAAINAADELNKLSQKVGVSVEDLSKLKYAGELSDVSLESMAQSMGFLSKNMEAARGGSKDAQASFTRLGVALNDANGKARPTIDVMGDIAEKFKGVKDGSAKTALAMQIFGRAGKDMIPLLNSGKDGLQQMAKEAERLGLVIDTQTARSAEEFNDNLTRVKASMTGATNEVVKYFLPALLSLSRQGVEGVNSSIGKSFQPMNLFKKVVQGVAGAVVAYAGAVKVAGVAVGTVLDGMLQAATIAWETLGTLAAKKQKDGMVAALKAAPGIVGEGASRIKRVVTDGMDTIGTSIDEAAKSISDGWTQIFDPATSEAPKATKALGDMGAETSELADKQREATEAAHLANLQDEITIAQKRGEGELVAQLTRKYWELTAAKMRASGVASVEVDKFLENQLAKKVQELGDHKVSELPVSVQIPLSIAFVPNEGGRSPEQQITDMLHNLAKEYKANATSFEDAFKTAIGNVEGLFTDVFYDMLTGKLSDLDDAFKSFFKSIARQIANLMAQRAVMALLGNGSNSGGWGSLVSAIFGTKAAADGAIFTGGFQAFANGGVVKSPTLGLIGEGSTDEAVIPMPSGRVPVQLLREDRGGRPVNIDQRIVISSDLLAAGKTSANEIVSVVTADIVRGGQIRRAIKAKA